MRSTRVVANGDWACGHLVFVPSCRAMQTDRYYRHSGRFSAIAVIRALVMGLVVSVPLAFTYSYAIVYIPVIGMVTFLLTAAFAVVVGLMVGRGLRSGKVRSSPAALAAALPVAIFALWAAWVSWAFALLRRSDVKLELIDLAASPRILWKVVCLINEKGAWSLKGYTPTGTVLWILWAIEAALILGAIVFMAHEHVNLPFCEPCEQWCEEEKGIAVFGPTTKDVIRPRLEQGDYGVFGELGDPTEAHSLRIDLHQCPKCQATMTLSGTSVRVTVNKSKRETHEMVLFRYLLIPATKVPDVRTVLGGLHAGPAASLVP